MFKIICNDTVLRLTPQPLKEWFCTEMALLGVVDRDVNGFFDVHTHLAFKSNNSQIGMEQSHYFFSLTYKTSKIIEPLTFTFTIPVSKVKS